ncbi:hypothetical protein [Luteimonas changyuni]|uniref:hypothetical protein n=1 Tax=Luteimonas sp. MJ145 TaxID=3129234 RepID=UPI0031BA80CE
MAVATTTLALVGLAATAVGAGVSLYATDTAAKQAEANANFQANQAEADARAARGEAAIEAERIRKEGKAQRARATAAAAASGIDVSSPTALKVNEEITRNAEEDAMTTVFNAQDRGARMGQQATADRIAGANARSAGRTQQASTLLSATTSMVDYGDAWKRARDNG